MLKMCLTNLNPSLTPSVRMVVAFNFLLKFEGTLRNEQRNVISEERKQAVVEKIMSPGNTPGAGPGTFATKKTVKPGHREGP